METIAIIIFGVGCFALGIYVTTQISSWIDNRIQHKRFLKNLEDFDKKQKKQYERLAHHKNDSCMDELG